MSIRALLTGLLAAALSFSAVEAADYYFAADVPAVLGGVDFSSHEIVQNLNGSYSSAVVLPQEVQIGALHIASGGAWLFSPSYPVDLGGVLYEPRDVVAFDGVNYSLNFDGSAAGIPDYARVDALYVHNSGSIALSFDVPVELNTVEYLPADIVLYDGAGYSLFWDAQAAGVPAGVNVVGADTGDSSNLILTFDVPVELGNVLYLPGQLVEWTGSSFVSFYQDNSWPADARLSDFAFPVPVNTAPDANDDLLYATNEDAPFNGSSVLANDTDADGDPLTAVLGSGPSFAVAFSLDSDGTFSYTPAADFHGMDSFTYRANDGTDNSDVAVVVITVSSINDDPVANDDSATLDQDTMLDVDVLGNDTDADNDTIYITNLTQGAHGVVASNGDGTVKYTPEPGFSGDDSFTYSISDGTATDTATVHMTINLVEPPSMASIDDVLIYEPQSSVVSTRFTVSLSKPAKDDITIDYETQDGTATSGDDYTGVSGVLTIPAGETYGSIEVDVHSDAVPFEGTETALIVLSNPQNAEINDGEGVLSIVENCLFCDDFEDGVTSPDWTYVKQAWTENGGSLHGTPGSRKATVVAAPVFSPGCFTCSVETTMQSAGGQGNRVWLLGWYTDKKNTTELMMKEESDKWLLKQRVNGKVVSKAKGLKQILPNVSYDVRVSFDGTQFVVSIDGDQLMTMPPGGPVLSGTIGFQVKGTTASFGQIVVTP